MRVLVLLMPLFLEAGISVRGGGREGIRAAFGELLLVRRFSGRTRIRMR
jgi:hypothetical protein